MRFRLVRGIHDILGKSIFGELRGIDNSFKCHTVEREWQSNRVSVSCVPEGFYVLEPHNGFRHKKTWALIGDTVSHVETSEIPRFACVFHWSSKGSGLQGCISLSRSFITMIDKPTALAVDHALVEFKGLLRSSPGPHYLTII